MSQRSIRSYHFPLALSDERHPGAREFEGLSRTRTIGRDHVDAGEAITAAGGCFDKTDAGIFEGNSPVTSELAAQKFYEPGRHPIRFG